MIKVDKNLLRWFFGRTEEESNISYYIKTTLLHVCLGMASPPYTTLCDFCGGLTSPIYNYVILPRIRCPGQKISPGPSWVIPRKELAQVHNITHPFWTCEAVISKDEALKQEPSWHQDQGFKLIIQQVKVTTNLTAFRRKNQLVSLSQVLHKHNWEKADIRGQREEKKGGNTEKRKAGEEKNGKGESSRKILPKGFQNIQKTRFKKTHHTTLPSKTANRILHRLNFK